MSKIFGVFLFSILTTTGHASISTECSSKIKTLTEAVANNNGILYDEKYTSTSPLPDTRENYVQVTITSSSEAPMGPSVFVVVLNDVRKCIVSAISSMDSY